MKVVVHITVFVPSQQYMYIKCKKKRNVKKVHGCYCMGILSVFSIPVFDILGKQRV